MTQTQDTPTPYRDYFANKVKHGEYYLDAGAFEVWICRNLGEPLKPKCGTDGREILARLAFTVDDQGCQTDYEKVMTNAAFIVRACNSHDALVEALEAAIPALKQRVDRTEPASGWDLAGKVPEEGMQRQRELHRKAKANLAAAYAALALARWQQ